MPDMMSDETPTASPARKRRMTEAQLSTLRRKYTNFTVEREKFLYGVKVDQSIASTAMPSLGSQPSINLPADMEDPSQYILDPLHLEDDGWIDDQKMELMKLKVKRGDIGAIKAMPGMTVKFERQSQRPSTAPVLNNYSDFSPKNSPPRKSATPSYALSSKDIRLMKKNKKAQNKSQVDEMLEQLKEQGSTKLRGDSCYEPMVGKGRCGLCEMFFDKKSLRGVISMKSILDLRKSWGVEIDNKRCKSASFLYTKRALCLFCSQQFDTKGVKQRKYCTKFLEQDDKEKGVKEVIANQIKLTSLISEKEIDEEMARNLAVGGTASQSSTVDGKLATRAITGTAGPKPPSECSMTRREYESWFEVDLGKEYSIKSVVIHHRQDSEGENHSYSLSPFWIFVAMDTFGSSQLSESKRRAHCAACVREHDAKTVWKLPVNTSGRCVRVQCEGIKSLQIAQIEVLKGGFVNAKEEGTKGTKGGVTTKANLTIMTTTLDGIMGENKSPRLLAVPEMLDSPKNSPNVETFTYEYLNAPPSQRRPNTAPAQAKTRAMDGFGSARPSTSGGVRKTLASKIYRANNGVLKKRTINKEATIDSVMGLIASTNTSYMNKRKQDAHNDLVLKQFSLKEVEALKRNFLFFSDVRGVPSRTLPTPRFANTFQELVEQNHLNCQQAVNAFAALREAGTNGPKSQKTKYFGRWDLESDVGGESALDSQGGSKLSGPASEGVVAEQSVVSMTNISTAYMNFINSYALNDLSAALVEISRCTESPLRVNWDNYVEIVRCCMRKDLLYLTKVFDTPFAKIKTGIRFGGGGRAEEKKEDLTGGSALEDDSVVTEGSSKSWRTLRAKSMALTTFGATMGSTMGFDSRDGDGDGDGDDGENKPHRRTPHKLAVLTLSQSLAEFGTAEAARSSPKRSFEMTDKQNARLTAHSDAMTPTMMRTTTERPKTTQGMRNKRLMRSENVFNSLVNKIAGDIEVNLDGMEYVRKLDDRRTRMQELLADQPKPKESPALNRKNCAICFRNFPLDALAGSITIKCMKALAKKWTIEVSKFGQLGSDSSLLMQHRVPICVFCNQFFDPDQIDGLAHYKSAPCANYLPFFDDNFPDQYNEQKGYEKTENSRRAQERKQTLQIDLEIRTSKKMAYNNYDPEENFKAIEQWDDNVNQREDDLENVHV